MTFRDRPVAHLTRHFYKGLFDLGFLSETGSMSFTRLVIGACALFLTFGLLLARVYVGKYRMLGLQATPDLYQQAILADHALLMAIPMWVVAFMTVLVGHAVFPDALDFRVLVALPINRRLVFGAKVLALTLFVGLFVVSIHVALTPLALLTLLSPWGEGWFVANWSAYLIASLLASCFAALAVIAVHGLLMLFAPTGQLLAISAVLRSVMLCVLVMSLPLLARLPAMAPDFWHGAPWLYLAPPAWFVGLERWLIGDAPDHFPRLAASACAAALLASTVAIGSYALLYGHFERLVVRSGEKSPSMTAGGRPRAHRLTFASPIFLAMRSFAFKTLRRSVLHQGIVVVLSAIGAGLVVNSFVGAKLFAWMSSDAVPRPALVASVIWTPFAFMYVACRAARMALLVPIETRANWVFRMTERDVSRADQIGAAVSTVYLLGVIVPIALLAPIQWLVLRADAVTALGVALVYGWLYVELLMMDWVRLPFTCSYIPGKRFLPQAVLIGMFQFLAFTTCSAGLVRLTIEGHPSALMIDAMVLVAAPLLHRRRVSWSRHTPLEFEDSLPSELNPLRLSQD